MKRKICLGIFLFNLLLIFNSVSASTNISNCSGLNVSDETYYLTADIINSTESVAYSTNSYPLGDVIYHV